ncbi:YdcF family protein [Thiobacter aerophilum]|uniref:YdcF family protein n=1 Tax=Thiobacter aerophilum TaxID=3121275 RepID=A0ABV0EEE2_9BURK
MDLAYPLTGLLTALFLPPGSPLVMLALGWAVWPRRPRLGRALVLAGTLTLGLLSLPFVSASLLRLLAGEPPSHLDFSGAQAIVVLGAGRYQDALEYGGDTVNRLALERLRYAARLARASGLPVLVSGGSPEGRVPEASFMKAVLEDEFGVPVRWVEADSRNTWENARFSQRILAREGIERIVLVTHAWHMPRARAVFERAGLKVVPAGTRFYTPRGQGLADWLPDARALLDSSHALHEGLGLMWYRLRGHTR